MDWLSALSGLVGVIVGAGASYFSSRYVLNRQLDADRHAREEAERTAVVAALSGALTALREHAARCPEDVRNPGREELEEFRLAVETWEQHWQPLVRAAVVGALEVRNAELRDRLTTGLQYLGAWTVLEFPPNVRRAWVLCGGIDHLVESLFAWRRAEQLPAPNSDFTKIKKAWDWDQENSRIITELEAKEAGRRRAEARNGRNQDRA